jgi:hypothetical protein
VDAPLWQALGPAGHPPDATCHIDGHTDERHDERHDDRHHPDRHHDPRDTAWS